MSVVARDITYLGIDFSTKRAHFVSLDGDGDGARAEEYDFGRGDVLERLRRVHYVLPAREHWDGAIAIGIERPASSKFGAWQVSMAFGAILQCLPYGVLVEMYWPSSWRKRVLGDGGASKEAVLAWARERWPGCPGQDSADAYCVARAMRADVGGAA